MITTHREKETTMNINTKTYRYRATCTCGHKGRWFINPNDAVTASENHAGKFDHFQGGKPDGRKHTPDVEETEK